MFKALTQMVAGTEQAGSGAIQAERHFEWLSVLLCSPSAR